MAGAVVSWTSTSKLRVGAALPEASCAEQVTVVWPNANTVPDAGEHVADTDVSTESLAAGTAKVTVAPLGLSASATTSAWAWMAGAVVSRTCTSKLLVGAALPAASCAEQLTVV